VTLPLVNSKSLKEWWDNADQRGVCGVCDGWCVVYVMFGVCVYCVCYVVCDVYSVYDMWCVICFV
jgi:hypothetical protein